MTESRDIDFSASYLGIPPWEIGAPQPPLAEIVEGATGRVLDIGCGTGELAMLAAASGLEAAGLDSAATAITIARRRAAERHLDVDFREGDAFELPTQWRDHFDLVVDSGVFHVFSDAERPRYVRQIAGALRPGGRYATLVFSNLEPGDWGPRRISPDDIRAAFADGWTVDAIEPSVFTLNPEALGRHTAKALRAQMTVVKQSTSR